MVETATAIQRDVEELPKKRAHELDELPELIEMGDVPDTAYTGEGDRQAHPEDFGEIPNRLGPVAEFLKSGRASLTGHVGNFSQPLRFSYDLLLGYVVTWSTSMTYFVHILCCHQTYFVYL